MIMIVIQLLWSRLFCFESKGLVLKLGHLNRVHIFAHKTKRHKLIHLGSGEKKNSHHDGEQHQHDHHHHHNEGTEDHHHEEGGHHGFNISVAQVKQELARAKVEILHWRDVTNHEFSWGEFLMIGKVA